MAEDAFEKVISELQLAPNEYEALDRDFQIMLQEMQGDQTLERFRQEYEKLHRTLKRSHEIEKRLIKRCKELNRDIQLNAKHVQEALRMAQKDSENIKFLKAEVEKAWKMVDTHKEKEERSKQTIHNLKQEINQLSKIVEQGAGISVNQEETIKQLMETREELLKEREAQQAKLEKLQSENLQHGEKLQSLETELSQLEMEKKNIKDVITQHKSNNDREERRRKRLEGEFEQAKKKRIELENELSSKEKNREDTQKSLDGLKDELKDLKKTVENLNKQIKDTRDDAKRLETEYKRANDVNKDFESKRIESQAMLKELNNQILELKQNNQHFQREINKQRKANKVINDIIADCNIQTSSARQNIFNLGKIIDSSKRQAEEDRKQIIALEEDLKNKEENVQSVENDTKKNQEELQEKKRIEESIKNDISEKERDAKEQYDDILRYSKIKEKFGMEASKANEKHHQCLEELKLKNNLIAELQKKNLEAEARLKHQLNLCETVRSERNLYSKSLIESQDNIAELRRNFKILNNQIDQLKGEIETKKDALKETLIKANKMKSDHKTVEKNREAIEKEIVEFNNKQMNQMNELTKLKEIITQADKEREQQKEQYERIIDMRDLLGTQLIRKNDELALLYEKIKIQQSALAKGEVMYQERIGDIRLLKFKIADLHRELAIVKNQASQIEELKQQVFLMEEELLQERTKVRALSEELENSMNANRYQELEGKDPPAHELRDKVERLQQRLISKTEQVVEHDVLIKEKERLLGELRNLLDEQPGVDVARELSFYKQNLRDTTRKMKSIASELNMFHSQVNEYKDEIERQTKDLQEYKRKYYEKKRADRD